MILVFTLFIVFILNVKVEENILTTSNYGRGIYICYHIQIILLEHNFTLKKVMEMVYDYLKILLNYNYVKIKNNSMLINS